MVQKYKAQIEAAETQNGYIGSGYDDFFRVTRPFTHCLTDSFKEMYRMHHLHPEDQIMSKYAACVPHVMIYVIGPLKYRSVKQIQLDRYTRIKL